MDETVTYGRDELKKHIEDYLDPKVLDAYIETLPKKPKQIPEEPEVPKWDWKSFSMNQKENNRCQN